MYYVVKLDFIFRRKIEALAKQEQNRVTVLGFYVLVLYTEMKSEPPCIVIILSMQIYARKKTNRSAVCKCDIIAVIEVLNSTILLMLSVIFFTCNVTFLNKKSVKLPKKKQRANVRVCSFFLHALAQVEFQLYFQ